MLSSKTYTQGVTRASRNLPYAAMLPCETRAPFAQLFLCLCRACLGKTLGLRVNTAQQGVVRTGWRSLFEKNLPHPMPKQT
jgi:hypothetical protein